MAKILMESWRQSMHLLLDGMGIDSRNVRRLVIDVRPGEVPVMHVEMIGDPRIVDMAEVLVGAPGARVDSAQSAAPDLSYDVRLRARSIALASMASGAALYGVKDLVREAAVIEGYLRGGGERDDGA